MPVEYISSEHKQQTTLRPKLYLLHNLSAQFGWKIEMAGGDRRATVETRQ